MLHHVLFFMVMISMTTLVLQRKHLLMSLLSLEAMILTLSITTIFCLGQAPYSNMFLLLILLTFGACEASLGLSLLVSMTRSYGSDNTNLLTMNKC